MSSRIVKKKKYVVKEIIINAPERHMPFDIVLPRNIHKVTAIIITATRLTWEG